MHFAGTSCALSTQEGQGCKRQITENKGELAASKIKLQRHIKTKKMPKLLNPEVGRK